MMETCCVDCGCEIEEGKVIQAVRGPVHRYVTDCAAAWQARDDALRAEVERLEAELASETERLEDEAAMWQQTVTDLEADNATLRSDLVLSSDQGYELARLSALTGIVLHSTTPHEMTEEMAAAVAALRAQLATGEGWRSVGEPPDEIDIDYLVWHQNDIDVMMWTDNGWMMNLAYWSPTHWQPLPALPQE